MIALITDFGLKDPFVGIMKGVIKSINPKVEVIDISHDVEPQSVRQAAFYLYVSYKYFKKGTIFICVVDPGVGSKRKIILAETENYYFLAPNNGVLSWTLKEEKPKKIIDVKAERFFLKPLSRTFHGRDIFAPVAAHLSLGKDPSDFGTDFNEELIEIPFPRLKIENEVIAGKIIAVDRFGNLITNLPETKLMKFLGDNSAVIEIKGKEIHGLKNSYSEAEKGELLAIIGSSGYLEISVREGSAEKYLNAKEDTPFRLKSR